MRYFNRVLRYTVEVRSVSAKSALVAQGVSDVLDVYEVWVGSKRVYKGARDGP